MRHYFSVWFSLSSFVFLFPYPVYSEVISPTLPLSQTSLQLYPEILNLSLDNKRPYPIQSTLVRKINLVSLSSQSSVPEISAITPILETYENRSLTLKDLQTLADTLTTFYVQQGYLASRVILVDQQVTNGEVVLCYQPGKLGDVKVEGSQKFQKYIRSRINAGHDRLITPDLNDQLKLLKSISLFDDFQVALRPSDNGETTLIVTVVEAKPLQVSFGVDNYSPPSVGSERVTSNATYRNLLGIGDSVNLSYFQSLSGGLKSWDLNYSIPLNPNDGTLEFRASRTHSRVTEGDFSAFGIVGNSSSYEVSFRQPLFRNFHGEFALSLDFSIQNGQTFLFDNNPFPFGIGPDESGNSRIRVLKFAQDYIRRGEYDAWALRSQFNVGMNIFDATSNPYPIPDGQFISWLGQVQRMQQIGNDHVLIVQADLQLTPNSLLPARQFILGGGQSLRGYRQSARSGDNGFRLSIEDRMTLLRNQSGKSILSLVPFLEMGAVWNHPNNPNQLRGENFLSSVGLGVIWQPNHQLQLHLDYGIPLINLSDRSQNLQDQALYFNLKYFP